MILLWGLREDDTLRSVYDWLVRRHASLAFANHAAIARSRVRLSTQPRLEYRFSFGGRVYPLDAMSAAYLRPYDARDYEAPAAADEAPLAVSHADLVHHLVNAWADSSSATVVNRPSAEATNHSKLRQALEIGASGFLVPDSLITNDRDRIREFQARHGSVIFKSMSSVRSVVKELQPAALDGASRLGPVLFQQRVVGRNIRVHVIRDKVFACGIDSDGIDYRYAPARIEPFDLPADIAARCVALTARLGLLLAGIDLIATPAGEWYCLEANPNPAFSYFDQSEDKVVARAVAEMLMSSDQAGPRLL